MRLTAVSYFALLLAIACPTICRVSIVAGAQRAGEAACCLETPASQTENCPGDQPPPSTPADPCKELSCFCSPYVMIERDSGADTVLTISELPMNACPSIIILVPCAGIDIGLVGRHALPAITAENSAALPLLI